MDPLEVSQGCVTVISGIISLIEIWKGKEQYLLSVREFLNSLGSTIEKYTNSNFNKTNQLAFVGLKKQLDEFEAFLLNEKKKNPVFKFFQGERFIEECTDYIDGFQKWLTTMNLDAAIHFNEETAKNFQEMYSMLKNMEETREKSKCSFKDDFQNFNAAAFWIKYFKNSQNVEMTEFSLHFKAFVYSTERMELPQRVLDKILKDIDSDGNKIVNFQEWDFFYDKIWSRFDGKAQFLDLCEKGDSPLKKSASLPPLKLIYKETNPELASKYKKYDFPINNQFVITETDYCYQDSDKKKLEMNFDLLNNPLLVGKDPDPKNTASLIAPNIAFNYHITTVSRKQFHITAKNKGVDKGYYITDLSLTNPTSFRVRQTPYALSPGMLIDLNTYLFEIQEVFPKPEFNEKSNFYVISMEEGENAGSGTEETIKKLKIIRFKAPEGEETKDENGDELTLRQKKRRPPKKIQETAPILKVRIMNPLLPENNCKYINLEELEKRISTSKKVVREKDLICLKSERIDKGTVYSFGSNKDNDIVIKEDLDDYACQFYYDHEKKGWFVVEKHELSSQNEYSSAGTLICLKNFQQYKHEQIGSIGHKLQDGMEIFFNYHVLGVRLQEEK